MNKIKHAEHCLWCGMPVKQPQKGRKKLFCNDNHRNYYFKKKKQGKTDDVLKYLQFGGTVQYSKTNDTICGKVLNIPDIVIYEGKTLTDLKKNFIRAIDDYIEAKNRRENKGTSVKLKTTAKPYMNDAIKKKLGLKK